MSTSPTDIKDESLYNSFEQFFLNLVDLLEEVPESEYPGKIEMEVEKSESGRSGSQSFVPDYRKLVTATRDAWDDLEEFSELVKTARDSEIFGKGTFHSVVSEDQETHLKRIVVPELSNRLFEISDGVAFEKDDFTEAYTEFEEILSSESYEFRTWAPLSNFSMEESELRLDSTLKIREITPSERGQIHDSRFSPSIAFGLNVDYVVESRFTISPRQTTPMNLHGGQEEIQSVTTALRLFSGSKKPYYPTLISESVKPLYSNWSGGQSPGEYDRPPVGKSLELSKEEGKEFVGFWKDFQTEYQGEDDELTKPINRFNQMHSAESNEDQLINCMIALEETLLKGAGGSGNFRLAARATVLLNEEDEDSEFIFDFFQQLYDARNGIVHRDKEIGTRKVADTELHAGEFATKARYFLAKTIRQYLELRGSEFSNVTEVNRDFLRPRIVERLKSNPE